MVALYVDVHTISFPLFFIRLLVLLLLIPCIPSVCWALHHLYQHVSTTYRGYFNTSTLNFTKWPFTFLNDFILFIRWLSCGAVQRANWWICSTYQPIFPIISNNNMFLFSHLTPIMRTLATLTIAIRHNLITFTFDQYKNILQQSIIYYFCAIPFTILPSTNKELRRRHHVKKDTNLSLRRILRYYLIIILCTRIIPRALTPCSATIMSSPNSNANAAAGRGNGPSGRGRGIQRIA